MQKTLYVLVADLLIGQVSWLNSQPTTQPHSEKYFPSPASTPFPFFHVILSKLVQTPWVAKSICSVTHTPPPLPLANTLGLPGAKWALGNPRDVTPSRKMISGLKVCVPSTLQPHFFFFWSVSSPSLPLLLFVSFFIFSPFILFSLTCLSFVLLPHLFLPFFFPFFFHSSALGYICLWIFFSLRGMVVRWGEYILMPIKIANLVSHNYMPGSNKHVIWVTIWSAKQSWLIAIYGSHFSYAESVA